MLIIYQYTFELEHTDTYRCVLTLDRGAVKPQGWNPMFVSLDGQNTLVSPLTGLRLWEVLGSQSDGLHHVDWNKDPLCWQ